MAGKSQQLEVNVAVSAEWKRALRTAAAICRRAAAAAFAAAPARRKPKTGVAELAIVLTSDAAVKKLNAAYRGKNKATDVLSFQAWTDETLFDAAPFDGTLGDVVIAKGVAARDARAENKALREHLAHLAVHGVLHLLGYDHERDDDARVMESLEISVLKTLGIPDPYVARVREQVRARRQNARPKPESRRR